MSWFVPPFFSCDACEGLACRPRTTLDREETQRLSLQKEAQSLEGFYSLPEKGARQHGCQIAIQSPRPRGSGIDDCGCAEDVLTAIPYPCKKPGIRARLRYAPLLRRDASRRVNCRHSPLPGQPPIFPLRFLLHLARMSIRWSAYSHTPFPCIETREALIMRQERWSFQTW